MAIWLAALAVAAAAAFAYYHWLLTDLSITSTPGGAQVRIDGRLAGRTPLPGQSLQPGLHLLEVTHSHYRVHQQQLELTRGENFELHVDLARGHGRLMVHSNPRGAWVEVDGERQPGTTPVLLTLASGTREVVLGMEERRVESEPVVVMADQTRELRVDLNMDPHGSLWVEVVPADARVTVLHPQRDYQPGMRLPIGEHPVRVARAGYAAREVRLAVRYGDNRHSIRLERAFAPLRVAAEPASARVRVRFQQSPDGPLRWHDYRPAMQVPVGPVEVRASAMGRRSTFRPVVVATGGAEVHLSLAPMNVTPGERFRDDLGGLGHGPAMVVVPPGSFRMGREDGPPSEVPARRVMLTEPFALGVTEVTVDDYRLFAADAGIALSSRLDDADGRLPVTHVAFADALAYAEWLSDRSGERYRLPSEAEWEYAARAGADSEYFFGDDPDGLCGYANVADQAMTARYPAFGAARCNDGHASLAPVAAFPPNAFGLHDVHGNVAEWVLECGMPSYQGAPDDGTPTDERPSCPTHGIRGGSWDDAVTDLASRKRNVARSASADRGFRLLREL